MATTTTNISSAGWLAGRAAIAVRRGSTELGGRRAADLAAELAQLAPTKQLFLH